MKERDAIILGALLHDIGKFYQRTGKKQDYSERVMQSCCPFNKEINDFTHKHGLWSGQFAKEIFGEGEVENLCLFHHKPRDLGDKIIQLADWLSSGERFEEANVKEGKSYEIPLMSIFSQLYKPAPAEESKYFPLTSIEEFGEQFFPQKSFNLTKNDYDELWKNFTDDVRKFKVLNGFPNDALETWFFIVKKYCSRIPSATPFKTPKKKYSYLPDISLFDHLRTTAAIAICLVQQCISEQEVDKAIRILSVYFNKKDNSILERLSEPSRFLLVCGDISGVQKFIYTITSKGAAKGLKGRSFYLQLFGNSVAKYILSGLELPLSNLIYSSGGKFYILVPIKTAKGNFKDKVNEIEKEIDHKLLEIHKGELGIILGLVPFGLKDFFRGNFNRLWGEVEKEVRKKKRVRFKQIIEEKYESIFGFMDEGGKINLCNTCKDTIVKEPNEKCSLCESFENLGNELAKSQLLIEEQIPVKKKTEIKRWEDCLKAFGYSYKFVKDSKCLEQFWSDLPSTIYLLNSTDFKKAVQKIHSNFKDKSHRRVSLAYDFVGQATPYKKHPYENEIKDFEDLAKDSEGIHRLGILRMDVDNLGAVFSKGLGERATISRVATLSSSLSLFFEGWLNKFIKNKYEKDIYLIYSGGDDLFLVGAWDKIINLSENIAERFKKFTMKSIDNTENLTLSSGIAILPTKYPLYKGAEIAGEFESASKEHKRRDEKDPSKNAVTFLGNTIGWEEFSAIEGFKNTLVRLIRDGKNEKKLPHGIINRLARIYLLYEMEKRELRKSHTLGEIKELAKYQQWRWRLVYYLKRQSKIFEDELERLQKIILKGNFIEHLDLPVRWAELLLRKEEKENE